RAAGDRRESTRSTGGSAPLQLENFPQRVTAQPRRRRPARPTSIRQDSRFTGVLVAGSRKKPIPPTNRPPPPFLSLLAPTGLDAAKDFTKAQNIYPSCASESCFRPRKRSTPAGQMTGRPYSRST